MAARKGKIQLRAATPGDCALLRLWDEQPHVIAADPNDDWAWEEELHLSYEWREQLIAEVDGRPIGFIQIIDPAEEKSQYWGAVPRGLRAVDLWIGKESDLRKGYGTEMMKLTLSRCFSPPEVEAVLIDPLTSNTGAHKFYQSMGFVPEEQRWFGKDHCLVHRLTRAVWEARKLV